MSLDALSSEDKHRLKTLIEQGLRVTQEIQDLKEGLKETLKTVAEELNVKPALLSKSIKVAFKASIEDEKDMVHTVEEILQATGRL